jgi:Holliday junction resolvase-like predicted endonuclease
MAISSTRLKTEKAARVYLSMRGFDILEQNWSLGRYKLDVIAKKNNCIYFISLNYQTNTLPQNPLFDSSEHNKRQLAAEAWLVETKWDAKYVFSTIEIVGQDFTVVGFNDDLI